MKYVSPSVRETAFNCPHCGALASQQWHRVLAYRLAKDFTPRVIFPSDVEKLAEDIKHDENYDEEGRKNFLKWVERMSDSSPFLEKVSADAEYNVYNLSLSTCFNCNQIVIWQADRMIYPIRGEAPEPNPDLPPEIARDYVEASSILTLSPRGAAALIRLAIQKLCEHVGTPGKNINDNIKALVADGLDPRVQQALDILRVIGNEAVHPGQMDLRDDRATAESLFGLLNLVASKLISEPKHVGELYAKLPEGKREAIEQRDKR